MKKRYSVILYANGETWMSRMIFSNVARADGYAKKWESCALNHGGHADWHAEVVELRPVKKAKGARA